MKHLLSFIAILTAVSVIGQQLQFKGQPVDSIFVKSNESAYQFDAYGTTKGVADYISFVYDSDFQQYSVGHYYRDKYKVSYRPDTLIVETRVYKSEIGKKVDSDKIASLLNSLSHYDRSSNLLTKVDTIELKELITEKRMRNVAKEQKIAWKFRKGYSTKKENTELFNSCASIDTFNVYLNERFNTSSLVLVTDYSNAINISISTKEKIYSFEGRYPNPIKQPWYGESDTSMTFPPAIVNPKINLSLYDLLPNKFLLKETISNEALVNDYITWFFDRRNMTN